jgi:hypothetical protein
LNPIVLTLLIFIVSIPLHEYCHTIVAGLLGYNPRMFLWKTSLQNAEGLGMRIVALSGGLGAGVIMLILFFLTKNPCFLPTAFGHILYGFYEGFGFLNPPMTWATGLSLGLAFVFDRAERRRAFTGEFKELTGSEKKFINVKGGDKTV